MAVSVTWYGNAMIHMAEGNALWKTSGGSSFKVALLNSTYTPNFDTHVHYSDLTNELATSGGYTQNSKAVTNPAVSYDSASNETRFTCDAAVWSGSNTFTARYAVFYLDASCLMFIVDFGADVPCVGGTFTVSPAATGFAKITT